MNPTSVSRLLWSDLHHKQSDKARSFYEDTKTQHIAIATAAIEKIKQEYPGGFPNSDIRAPEEPLMGGPDD